MKFDREDFEDIRLTIVEIGKTIMLIALMVGIAAFVAYIVIQGASIVHESLRSQFPCRNPQSFECKNQSMEECLTTEKYTREECIELMGGKYK